MKHMLRLLLLLLPGSVLAADATLTWTHPTQRVDNTPITLAEIKETQIDWAVCATGNTFPATALGTKAVPAPATTTVITGLAYGTWCFRARSVDTLGEMSANSGTVWKQDLAPPKPPVLSSTITIAYETWQFGGKTYLGRSIGTLPLGTACFESVIQSFGTTYYSVAKVSVTLKPGIVANPGPWVTKCAVA